MRVEENEGQLSNSDESDEGDESHPEETPEATKETLDFDKMTEAMTELFHLNSQMVVAMQELQESALRSLPPPDSTRNIAYFSGLENLGEAEFWLTQLNSLATIFHWTEEMKFEIARSRLTRAAKNWYLCLSDVIKDWQSFETTFKETFTPQRSVSQKWMEMEQRVQGANEDFREYFFDKARRCKELELDLEDTKMQIAMGLQEKHICNALMCKEYLSLNAMLQDVWKLEQLKITRKKIFPKEKAKSSTLASLQNVSIESDAKTASAKSSKHRSISDGIKSTESGVKLSLLRTHNEETETANCSNSTASHKRKQQDEENDSGAKDGNMTPTVTEAACTENINGLKMPPPKMFSSILVPKFAKPVSDYKRSIQTLKKSPKGHIAKSNIVYACDPISKAYKEVGQRLKKEPGMSGGDAIIELNKLLTAQYAPLDEEWIHWEKLASLMRHFPSASQREAVEMICDLAPYSHDHVSTIVYAVMAFALPIKLESDISTQIGAMVNNLSGIAQQASNNERSLQEMLAAIGPLNSTFEQIHNVTSAIYREIEKSTGPKEFPTSMEEW